MSLNYVNLMDKYCYDEFIRTAPQPEVIPRSGEIQQLNITDEELRCITTAPVVEQESQESGSDARAKRSYVKISQNQLDSLKNLYREKGPNYPSSQYSMETGIKGTRIKNLILMLKKGRCIDKSTVRKGRNRKIGETMINMVSDLVKDNNRIRLKTIKEKLKENDVDVSVSTVCRTLNDRMKCYNLPNLSLKRCVIRSSRVEDIETLKDQRIEVIKKLHSFKAAGYRVLYLDESHWNLGIISRRARSEVNTPAVVHSNCSPTSITVIATMSDLGTHYCQAIYGSNNFEVYKAFIKHLLEDISKYGCRFVIFLDNVNLHHNLEIESMILDSGHQILFNCTYSSPMNPIENIFSIWKRRAEHQDYQSTEKVLKNISDAFATITPQECYSTIEHINHSIHSLVINRVDI